MLNIQPLSGRHNRSQFQSGGVELDRWFHQTAQQHQKRGISKTFVAVDDAQPGCILGYYALTACEVLTHELPVELAKRLPRRVPGIRLGRLAVAEANQGQGLGELLLMDAIRRSRMVLQHVGVHALFVDAKDTQAAAFYLRYGFLQLPDQPLQLVLVLAGLD